MEDAAPKSPRWFKIGLMLVVLVPFISTAFFFIYFWWHGVSIAK